MAAVIDATVNGEDSNSYVTLLEADTYFETRLNVDAWEAATDDTKNRSLIQATRYLDTYFEWQGSRATDTQALDWGRSNAYSCETGDLIASDTIPISIKESTYEQAFYMLTNTDFGSVANAGDIKKAKIDVIEVEYFEGGTVSASTAAVPTGVIQLVGCLGEYSGSGHGRLVRY